MKAHLDKLQKRTYSHVIRYGQAYQSHLITYVTQSSKWQNDRSQQQQHDQYQPQHQQQLYDQQKQYDWSQLHRQQQYDQSNFHHDRSQQQQDDRPLQIPITPPPYPLYNSTTAQASFGTLPYPAVDQMPQLCHFTYSAMPQYPHWPLL